MPFATVVTWVEFFVISASSFITSGAVNCAVTAAASEANAIDWTRYIMQRTTVYGMVVIERKGVRWTENSMGARHHILSTVLGEPNAVLEALSLTVETSCMSHLNGRSEIRAVCRKVNWRVRLHWTLVHAFNLRSLATAPILLG